MKVAPALGVMGRKPEYGIIKGDNMSKIKQLVPQSVDQFDELDYDVWES